MWLQEKEGHRSPTKNINIREFQIKQQPLNFLQNRYISFHCEHKKRSAQWIGKTKELQHGYFGGLSIDYFASWHSCSLFTAREYSCQWNINFWPFPFFSQCFYFIKLVVFSIQREKLTSTAPWTLRIREDKRNLCSDSTRSMIFPRASYAPDNVAGLGPWKDGPSSCGCPISPIIPRWWWFRMVQIDSYLSPISHWCLKVLSTAASN